MATVGGRILDVSGVTLAAGGCQSFAQLGLLVMGGTTAPEEHQQKSLFWRAKQNAVAPSVGSYNKA